MPLDINPPVPSEIKYDNIYYAEGELNIGRLDPLAIKPSIVKDTICWHNTGKMKSFKFSKISETADKKTIEILTDAGEKIKLTLLDLALFNEKVKKRVAGKPEFKTEEELKEHYLKKKFDTLS